MQFNKYTHTHTHTHTHTYKNTNGGRYAKLFIAFDTSFTSTADDGVLKAISSEFLFQLGFLLVQPIPLLLTVEQVENPLQEAAPARKTLLILPSVKH